MSTRGAIARWTDPRLGTWAGVSHHCDAYPTGLGISLYNLVALKVLGDLPSMLKVLIDEHPAGWSRINDADSQHVSGLVTDDPPDRRPICSCHGERQAEGQVLTDADAAASGVEWAYVFDTERETTTVLEARVDGAFVREIRLRESEGAVGPAWGGAARSGRAHGAAAE
jgi:hypothetical protein